MPVGTLGFPITLEAQYVDGFGNAAVPTGPKVDIIDPIGTTVVNDDDPVADPQTGHYHYDYDVPSDALVGAWRIRWTGLVGGNPVEEEETFSIVASGDIVFGADCSNPMWASVEELMAINKEITDDEAAELLIEATWLLNGLLYDRYHEVECRLDVYRSRSDLKKIVLAHQPVETVFSVERFDACGDSQGEVDGWCELAGGEVQIATSAWSAPSGAWWLTSAPGRLSGGVLCPPAQMDSTTLHIRYRVGSNLPPGAKRHVLKLANEFWKSSAGKSCALPERITNVTRQGVSWTILDPLDFLDKGLTGIGSIDLWVSRINRQGPAGLIDPLTRPPLLESTVETCGVGCTPPPAP